MKTTLQEILEKALVGKVLVSDNFHTYLLKITAVECWYDGEYKLTLESGSVITITDNTDLELRGDDMFYCDECATKKNWLMGLFKSYGKCEICGKTRPCNDVKSSECAGKVKGNFNAN